MVVDIFAIIILIITIELWFPIALIFGFLKFLLTLSFSAGWVAFKSVPIWIWDFVHNLF